MNYFLLAETDFFRLINEAGDCNMETAYTAFATQVIELCNGGMDMNLTVIALAYIEIELQHHPVRNLSEEKREIAAYVSKALSFVRKMQKFLATPQVPPLISANNVLQGNIYRNRTNYHSKFQTEGCRRVVGVSFPSACELLCRRPPLFQRGGMGIYAVFPERHAALCGESEKR